MKNLRQRQSRAASTPSCRAFPLQKQSTGLFLNSPLSSASGVFSRSSAPNETLSLDRALFNTPAFRLDVGCDLGAFLCLITLLREKPKQQESHRVTKLSAFARCAIDLIEFRTARTITPTSAKIASHIFAIPSAPSSRQPNLTASANTMF